MLSYEKVTEIIRSNFRCKLDAELIEENLPDIMHCIADIFEAMAEETKQNEPYATKTIKDYETTARELKWNASDFDFS